MKLTTLLLLVGCLHISAASLSQTVSIKANKWSITQVFDAIRQQTSYQVMYSDELIDPALEVSLTASRMPLDAFLDKVLKPLSLTYQVKENTILIGLAPRVVSPAIVHHNDSRTQQRAVSGKITDEKGNPLEGVTVRVKGTAVVTTSNVEGYYEINLPSNGTTITYRILGFQAAELEVVDQLRIDISLKTAVSDLDEVVVVGYGTVKRSNLTGSVASIKESDIKATPIVSLDRALQGRVPGVNVTSNSARPGGATSIRIRGTGSVNAGNGPLFVIDGFPTGDLNSINPNDIESIEILKDASATAIYGSRGSNGVVMVTTRRGKQDQTNIGFESYAGMQSVRRSIPLLSGQEYATFINEARRNAGLADYFDGSSADRPVPAEVTTETDWQDEVFRSAPLSNYQLTLSDGSSKTRYLISGNYYNQQGVVENSFFKRYTLRANVDQEFKSWLKTGLSLQGAHTTSNSSRTETDGGGSSGVTNAALNFAPVNPIFGANNKYYRDFSPLNGSLVDNPVGLANEVTDQYRTIRLLSNFFAEVKFAEGLVFKTTFGADLLHNKSNYYASRLIGLGAGVNGLATISASQNINWLNENTLTYDRVFHNKHNLTALLGFTTQSYHNEAFTASGSDFTNDFALYHNLAAGATLRAPSSAANDWALNSYIARANYAYDNRYILTVTGRVDGSSRFGPDNKYGFFPSAAFAWRAKQEQFLANVDAISDLKVRASYGSTGNQAIGDYQYLANIVASTAVLGGGNAAVRTGSVPNRISNLALGWERNNQLDIGLDIGFFNNRLTITADYYNKETSQLLFSVSVPQTTGYSNSLQNIGKVQNRGFELAVGSINLDGKFKWSTDFNIAFNRNQVLVLDNRPEIITGEGSGHLQVFNTVLLKVGEPLGDFYGRIVDGIFQTQEEVAASAQPSARPGDFKYRDINDDGVINNDDRTVIGNGYPDFYGGINNTFSYKGFDLNVFFQGSYGNDILNFNRFELYSLNANNNQSRDVLQRWTPENPSNEIPRANAAGGQRILSSFHIEDGSYLRLKNLSIGYNFAAGMLRKIHLGNAKIYLSAQNLWTLTNYKGYDPEVSRFGDSSTSQGMDYGSYPTARTFLVGLNFNLL